MSSSFITLSMRLGYEKLIEEDDEEIMKNYEERIDEEKAIFYHPLPPFRGGDNIRWKIYKRNSKIKMSNVLKELNGN